MKNQIYIILAIINVISACKTDIAPELDDNIHVLTYYYPREITRENSSFALFADQVQNIDVIFENNSTENNEKYNLYLEGKNIQFLTEGECLKPLYDGEIIDSSLEFSNQGSIDFIDDTYSCELTDSTYIGIRRTFNNSPYREEFGYLLLVQEIKGYWVAKEYIWNSTNHKAIYVGQRE